MTPPIGDPVPDELPSEPPDPPLDPTPTDPLPPVPSDPASSRAPLPPVDDRELTAPDLHPGEKRVLFAVAVVAAVVALLGAVVGATATLWAARTQADTATEATSSTWVRDQRRALYAQVLEKITVAQALDLEILALVSNVASGQDTFTVEKVEGLATRYSTAFEALFYLNPSVTLLSSTTVTAKFGDIVLARTCVRNNIDGVALAVRAGDMGWAAALATMLGDCFEKPVVADDAFLRAARAELGIPAS